MERKRIPITDHGSEILVLAIIAIGVMILAGIAIRADSAGEASAWTAVLMAIIGAIKERWQSRSIDRMGDQLAQASPSDGTVNARIINKPNDPVPTTTEEGA